ncbi:hypothetical protein JO41_05955 [Treponema sp. OMZ 838]|uniref:DUF4097 family beta strand repeat-containing protein n=1 Tax=Treponema sp. OMZ 838 TaxID=1539298 RepID=UPI00053015E4|nr:DUF4097 family beta strand repeat-containing protein [Treponema sp. OMZ 838]AIW89406.1 hypothetical protein JO41_05955 [Treponema sp. OMZ 838]
MKRRIRTAFAIIGIGGLLIIIGILMGGSVKKTFYNEYHDEKWSMDEEWNMDNKNTGIALSADMHETQLPTSISALNRLKADVSYVTLRIIPHDKQSVTYSIMNNTKKMRASVQAEGNTLMISTEKERKWNWFFGWSPDIGRAKIVITVKIPQNMLFDTADINIGAGSLLLDSFTANQRFTLNAGAAAIDIKNITASNVDIKTGIGETVFRNCSFTDTVMNTGIGETSFDGKICKNLDINAGIGEIDMRINGKKDDYLINATSGIGSILIDGRSARGLDSTFRINNQNALHTICVKAGIGKVNIRFAE